MKIRKILYEEYIASGQPIGILAEKIALVIGAGSGIGESIARNLEKAGASVIISGRNRSKLEETRKHMLRAHIETCDLENDLSIKDVLNNIHTKFGKSPDIVINSAGIRMASDRSNDPLLVTANEWKNIFETNFEGNKKLLKEYNSKIDKNGIYIAISSTDGIGAAATAYGLSKACLNAYIKECASIYKKLKIFGIAPGPTATRMMNEKLKFNYYRKDHPDKRCAVPQDIANMAVFISSGLFHAKSGEILVCDGGKNL